MGSSRRAAWGCSSKDLWCSRRDLRGYVNGCHRNVALSRTSGMFSADEPRRLAHWASPRLSWCCAGRRRASARGNTASETGSSRRACARSGGRRRDERNHHSARNYSAVLLNEALRHDAELARWPSGLPPVAAGLGRSTSEREPSRLTSCAVAETLGSSLTCR